MWISIGILVLLLVAHLILGSLEQGGGFTKERSKKYMIRFASLLLILQSGLRNVAVGPDTYAYSLKFVESLKDTWHDIFHNFLTVYVDGEGKDAGYYLLQKIFSSIIPDFQCFLIFIAIVFFCAFFSVVSNYTTTKTDVLIVVFVYLSLFYEFFSVTGCRQVLATAFCLFSVYYIRECKLVPFLLIMLVAISVHRSSLIFLPFYFISRNQKPTLIYWGSVVLIPLLIAFSGRYATELAVLSGADVYMMYTEGGAAGSQNFLIFYLIICTFLLAIQNRVLKEDANDLFIFNAIYLALFFIPLTYSSAALMRVVQYYSLFLTIGMTFFLRKSVRGDKNATIFLLVSLMALGYRLASNVMEYKFFWQTMELPPNY